MSEISPTSVLHVVIGSFDGVHVAHQELISKAIKVAKENKEQSMIFSFEPLPKEFFLKEKFLGRLLPADKKQEQLESFGADHVIITDFKHIRNFSEKKFMELLLTKADKIVLYSGNDFRMGCVEGESYKGKQISSIIYEDIMINGDICRSSHIRNLILEGQVERANMLLNKEYTLYSHTVHGNKIGRSINFPTINTCPNNQIIPKLGVYFGEITVLGLQYPAAIYVGKRPTVHGIDLRIENHIIEDFPYKDIPAYTPTEVKFISKIDEEKHFNSLEELSKMLYNYKRISLGLATKRYKNK